MVYSSHGHAITSHLILCHSAARWCAAVVRAMYVANGPGQYLDCGHPGTPGRTEMSIDIHDYVRHRTPHENFGGYRLRGGGCANTQFVPPVYIFILLVTFFDSFYKATAETAEPILRLIAQTTRFHNHCVLFIK